MALDWDFDYWRDLNPERTIWQAKGAKDPDTMSATLQAVHQALWTKPLPNGQTLELLPAQGCQLQWGKFRLSSDCFGNDYSANGKMEPIRRRVPDASENLFRWGSRIGSYLLFPGYQVDRKMTINGARGINTKIADRIDLTLDSIKRHYSGDASPLGDVFGRYADFFDLFLDFRGYIEFWLLQDLVQSDNEVIQLLPFDEFQRSGYPADVDEYERFCNRLAGLIRARNQRIANSPQAQSIPSSSTRRRGDQSQLPV